MCEENIGRVTWFANLDNTSDNNLGGDRLQYYMDHVSPEQLAMFGINENRCPVCQENEIEVGAHIGLISASDRHVYILPLCRSCNKKSYPLPLPNVQIVPVSPNTDGFSKIRYPEFAITMIKWLAHGWLNNWDGSPQKN